VSAALPATVQPIGSSRDTVDSDTFLVQRVAARDGVAFRTIAERETRILHRIAYRMLGDAAAADDIVQEALLRLWDGAARWKPGTHNLAAWLRRVATNLCLDQLRRRKFTSDDLAPEREDDAPLADAALLVAQLRAQVAAALGALPDRQRAAIILTYYEALPNAEAAETLDMNIKAFESLLRRARQTLHGALTRFGAISVEDVRGMP
jgi:RNA polymerase sigma factor (sigma-70 family)